MRTLVNGITIEYRTTDPGGAVPAGETPKPAEGASVQRKKYSEGSPPILFSHSLAADLHMWERQVQALSGAYPTICFDTRGHGGSSVPAGPYSVGMLVDDVSALLDALEVPRVHFVGLSLGGIIAQRFALTHPERLSSLVLCDTSPRTPPESHTLWDERIESALTQGMGPLVEPTISRWFTPPFIAEHPDVVDAVRHMISSTDPVGYAGCAEAVKRHDLLDVLGRIQTPTLIIAGSQDPGMPSETAMKMRDAIPRAELAVIEPASHLSNVEQPDLFNDTLLGFLSRMEAGL